MIAGDGVLVGEISIIEEFCVASAVLTTALCSYAPVFGRITKLMDRPDGVRKLHVVETPLVGGPALLIPSLVVSAIYLAAIPGSSDALVAVAAAALTLVIGITDDRMAISPVARLVVLTGVIFAVFAVAPSYVLHSLRFQLFDTGFWIPLGPFAVPITAVVILGFINAVNMADGINGQLLGSIIIWCGFIIYFLGPVDGMPFVAIACSAAVAFVFNLRGHLFSGSSGAYASALFVGLGAIFTYHTLNGALPADTILGWFWLPIVDCIRLMVSRALQGRSPLSGDRNHFHHILLRHMRPRVVLVVYLALLAAPGLTSIADRTLGSFALLICMLTYAILSMPKMRPLDVTKAAASAGVTQSPRHRLS